jgi:ribosomal protein S27E
MRCPNCQSNNVSMTSLSSPLALLGPLGRALEPVGNFLSKKLKLSKKQPIGKFVLKCRDCGFKGVVVMN